jgi:hypothetical protein
MGDPQVAAPPDWPGSLPLDSTAALIQRVKAGDPDAREQLAAPSPSHALGAWKAPQDPAMADTADLVRSPFVPDHGRRTMPEARFSSICAGRS